MKSLYSIVLLALTTLSWAQPSPSRRHIAFLGGSGDPAGATTIFDPRVGDFGNYVEATQTAGNQIDLKVAFDGGHSTTEGILRTEFPTTTAQNFTRASYRATIQNYIQQMTNGSIRRGDQVMVAIDTHGAQRQEGETTHSLAAGAGHAANLTTLEGSGENVRMDELEELATLANEKGVKLAILDMSCHSGASIPLANANTCVITSTGVNNLAWGSSLFSRLRPGMNLEEAFLDDLGEQNQSLNVPMISTEVGHSIQDELFPLLSRYLNRSGGAHNGDKLRLDMVPTLTGPSCFQESADVSRILALTQQWGAAAQAMDFAPFTTALRNYADYQQQMREQLLSSGFGTLQDRHAICGAPARCREETVENILMANITHLIEGREREVANAATAEHRADAQHWLSYYRNMEVKKQQILTRYPDLADNVRGFFSNHDVQMRTNDLALAVARESRRLYRTLYQQRSQAATGPNPCRDFKL